MIQRLPGIIFHLSIYVSSILGNPKARQMINNRNIRIQNEKFDFWIHASSLGEYWMVEKLIRDLEKRKKKVFVSIFSPSAWDIVSKKEKYYGYIPIDRLGRLNTFLDIINPKFAVFAKYDLWGANANFICGKSSIKGIIKDYSFSQELPAINNFLPSLKSSNLAMGFQLIC